MSFFGVFTLNLPFFLTFLLNSNEDELWEEKKKPRIICMLIYSWIYIILYNKIHRNLFLFYNLGKLHDIVPHLSKNLKMLDYTHTLWKLVSWVWIMQILWLYEYSPAIRAGQRLAKANLRQDVYYYKGRQIVNQFTTVYNFILIKSPCSLTALWQFADPIKPCYDKSEWHLFLFHRVYFVFIT